METQLTTLTTGSSAARVAGSAKKSVNGVITILNLDTEVTTTELIFKKPDGNKDTFTAVITNSPGTDGEFHYDTILTYFTNNPGWWGIQAKYTLTDAKILFSTPVKQFYIAPILLDD